MIVLYPENGRLSMMSLIVSGQSLTKRDSGAQGPRDPGKDEILRAEFLK